MTDLESLCEQIRALHPGVTLDLRTQPRAEIAAEYAAVAAARGHRLSAIREDHQGAALRFSYIDQATDA